MRNLLSARFITIGFVTMASVLASQPARAQTLTGQLARLLTEQRPSAVDFVPDVDAAVETTKTVAGLFLIELANVPLSSSAGGFVYRLNPQLAVVERASDTFGPFFSERVLRNSRGHSSLGVTFQASHYSTLQGASLTAGNFPTNADREAGDAVPFSVDTLRLDMNARSVTIVGSYGITDRLAVGGAVPVVQVQFDGDRSRTTNGVSSLQSTQFGRATGFGDMAVHTRYVVAGVGGSRGVAVGADLIFPTGREEDLLGSGSTAGRFLAIGSWEEGPLAVHLNGGYGVGGTSREIFWRAATTVAVAPRLTVVGEVIGRRLSALSRVQDVYEPHASVPGVEVMRWLDAKSGVNMTFFITGAKWNIAQSWLLNANVLIRASDAGLRARVTPSILLDYDFFVR